MIATYEQRLTKFVEWSMSDECPAPQEAQQAFIQVNGYPWRSFSRAHPTKRGSQYFSYIAATPDSVFDKMQDTEPWRRTFHEMIIGPCHFYADLEYEQSDNPEITMRPEDMLEHAIKSFQTFAKQACDLEFRREDLVILDGCRNTKVSYHLIWPIHSETPMRFFDNSQCGALMRRFMLYMHHCGDSTLLVRKADQHKTVTAPFYDLGVYTQKRQFRLIGNHKPVKSADTPFYNLVEMESREWDDREQFMRTIIADPHYAGETVRVNEYSGHPASTSSISYEELLKRALGVQLASADDAQDRTIQPFAKRSKKGRKASASILRMSEHERVDTGVALTRYPALNKIADIVRAAYGSLGASFELWWEDHMILISCTSRQCKIAGREHKHNHICFNVNIAKGEMSQRCLDDDCKAAVREKPELAPRWSLPQDVWDFLREENEKQLESTKVRMTPFRVIFQNRGVISTDEVQY